MCFCSKSPICTSYSKDENTIIKLTTLEQEVYYFRWTYKRESYSNSSSRPETQTEWNCYHLVLYTFSSRSKNAEGELIFSRMPICFSSTHCSNDGNQIELSTLILKSIIFVGQTYACAVLNQLLFLKPRRCRAAYRKKTRTSLTIDSLLTIVVVVSLFGFCNLTNS